MRSGVQRSKTELGLWRRTNDGVTGVRAFSAGAGVPLTTACRSRRAFRGGRAASRMGQSSMLLAEKVAVSPAGSCVGQCGVLSAVGARQAASHQARAGAAAATTAIASMMTRRRNISFSIA